MARPRVQARVPARVGATRQPRVRARVPARAGAACRPRIAAGARVAACPQGIAPARRAAQPRVTVPARVIARARAAGRAQVTTRAGAAILVPVTTEARVTVSALVAAGSTIPSRVTAVQAIRAARLHGTVVYRMLPLRTLIYGPTASGTVPPVRTPAALTAVVAGGAPGGTIVGASGGMIVGVAGGSTVGVEAGVTSGHRPTPARICGGLRTAVAHAPLTTLRPATVTIPKSLHHEAPAQAPLPGRRGRSHLLRSVSSSLPRVPATATGRPRGFPEREVTGEAAVAAAARGRALGTRLSSAADFSFR